MLFTIDSQKATKKKNNFSKAALASLVVGSSFFLAVSPSFAATVTSPIDDLKVETDKVAGIFDALVAPAVGSTVFAIGAVLVKRIAFS
jgi:hypothetical protein